jgi:hypothetical protein
VPIPPFYIAMASPGATESPTDEAFERLLNAVDAYFTSVLAEAYGAGNDNIDFIELDLKLNNTRFELGIPLEQYNLFMDFVASAIFTISSTTPLAQDMYDLLRASITPTFILNVVRSVDGTAFAQVNEAFFDIAMELP